MQRDRLRRRRNVIVPILVPLPAVLSQIVITSVAVGAFRVMQWSLPLRQLRRAVRTSALRPRRLTLALMISESEVASRGWPSSARKPSQGR
jgi:hypothetical protein